MYLAVSPMLRYFYPPTFIAPATFSDPLLHSSQTSSLRIPRSHAEYLGHARLLAARIRCHLRPKHRKEGQISRHSHPIIGPAVIDGKPSQTHPPTDSASHGAIISAYLLIHFGWFTDPSRSWLFLPAWIALSGLPPSKSEGCIYQMWPSSFPVDLHCHTQCCEFHCCWGSSCTVNHPSIPISHIASSTRSTTNNGATLQQHALMSCMSLHCIHQTIPLAMLLMIFHAAPKLPTPAQCPRTETFGAFRVVHASFSPRLF